MALITSDLRRLCFSVTSPLNSSLLGIAQTALCSITTTKVSTTTTITCLYLTLRHIHLRPLPLLFRPPSLPPIPCLLVAHTTCTESLHRPLRLVHHLVPSSHHPSRRLTATNTICNLNLYPTPIRLCHQCLMITLPVALVAGIRLTTVASLAVMLPIQCFRYPPSIRQNRTDRQPPSVSLSLRFKQTYLTLMRLCL